MCHGRLSNLSCYQNVWNMPSYFLLLESPNLLHIPDLMLQQKVHKVQGYCHRHWEEFFKNILRLKFLKIKSVLRVVQTRAPKKIEKNSLFFIFVDEFSKLICCFLFSLSTFLQINENFIRWFVEFVDEFSNQYLFVDFEIFFLELWSGFLVWDLLGPNFWPENKVQSLHQNWSKF